MAKFQKYRKGKRKPARKPGAVAPAPTPVKASDNDKRIHFPSPTGKRGRPRIDQPLCGLV